MFFNGFFVAFAATIFQEAFCEEDFSLKRNQIGINPGPLVVATQGEVWPKPHSKTTTEEFLIVRPNFFEFKIIGQRCDILEKALQRYKQDLRTQDRIRRSVKSHYLNEGGRQILVTEENFKGYLDELLVDLRAPCENLPKVDMNENYGLRVNTDDFPNRAILVSQSIWGMLRGLETWSQLVYSSSDHNALLINSTAIMDFPRFPHRGLLIDTSRHFLPLRIIYATLDAMAMNKMNVLHWHIVDDQSFPFQSKIFPGLSDKGAYSAIHVYTPADVQSVITYAAYRGIRVIPEFDTPGHTRSWGEAYPELLTECYSDEEPDGSLGAMNPIVPGTYDFMKKLMIEIKDTFPDSYIHLGGDEVEFQCWESNPEIRAYMENRGLTPSQLEGIYIKEIIEMASNLSATSVVWQEVFDDGVELPNDTLVHVWKSNFYTELTKVTKNGYKALLSSCWYLDGLSSGGDWKKFFRCDPHDFRGSQWQKRLVIGGEACMWGEVVDVNNVMSRVWPRASAAAERLWSPALPDNLSRAAQRLEEHVCRMNRRKIHAQPPNGPGFCPGLNFS